MINNNDYTWCQKERSRTFRRHNLNPFMHIVPSMGVYGTPTLTVNHKISYALMG